MVDSTPEAEQTVAAPGPAPEPSVILAATRERSLARLLVLYVATGLFFMLLPGTFLGVWNLVMISSRQAASSVSAAWLQAHGHAQVFGWIGSFILGIGFYSIPKAAAHGAFRVSVGWLCWALWTSGVALRWTANIYQWHWRILLPVSAALELVAFLLFFRAVSGHRLRDDSRKGFENWILLVFVATVGLLLTLALNFGESVYLSLRGQAPAFPTGFDQRFLVLATWGSLVPLVWGFSARWMPTFLGLKTQRFRPLVSSLVLNSLGVLAALAGWLPASMALLFSGAVLAPNALRLFEPGERAAKVRGAHPTFPVFVRLAYAWLIVAAGLGIWAVQAQDSTGLWGASRHALTVGFVSTMVLTVGQRVLPAFSGALHLFSIRMMFFALALLTAGCALRVTSEVLAYQDYAGWAWQVLPVSALCELVAISIFGINMMLTLALRPPAASSRLSAG